MSLLLLPVFVLAAEMKLPAPTCSGLLPRGFSGTAILDTSHAACFLADSGDRVIAYTWEFGALKKRYDLPRLDSALHSNDSLRPCGFSLWGDVDGDGIDEFVVAVNRTISKYKLTNGTLALIAQTSLSLPADSHRLWVTDGCIGDIDNDGRNEILISATSLRPPDYGPDYGDDSPGPDILLVRRWTQDSLFQTWDDGGMLQIGQGEMWAVADPRNIGTNELILLEWTGDDVHAALFREVEWHAGRFRDAGTFRLRRGQLQRDQPSQDNREAFRAATGCRFGHINGKTAIIADIFDGDEGREEFFIFSGDSVTQHLVLWPGAWTASFVDLDGRGVGILRIMNPAGNRSGFEFYRL
jgi:hypothetical protein